MHMFKTKRNVLTTRLSSEAPLYVSSAAFFKISVSGMLESSIRGAFSRALLSHFQVWHMRYRSRGMEVCKIISPESAGKSGTDITSMSIIIWCLLIHNNIIITCDRTKDTFGDSDGKSKGGVGR